MTRKPLIFVFLKVWQVIELLGLVFLIPLIFIFGILFTGDSYSVFNYVKSYIIPPLAVLLLVKIIVFIAFLKYKRWAIYFNIIQNIILALIFITLTILTIYTGAFSIFQVIFIILYILLTWFYYKWLSFHRTRMSDVFENV